VPDCWVVADGVVSSRPLLQGAGQLEAKAVDRHQAVVESPRNSWKEPPPGAVQALLLLVRRPISGSSDLASAHACLRGDALVRLHRCGRLPSRVSDHSRRKAPECALREIITEVQNIEIACLRDLGDGARQNIGNHIARGRLSGLDLRPADTGHIDTALRGPGRSRYRMRRNSHACRAKARSGCC
jgi:hypothetical protein